MTYTPSHGHGELRPFEKGDERARELGRKGAEATRRKHQEAIEAAAMLAEQTQMIAEQRSGLAEVLRGMGVRGAKQILADASIHPQLVAEMARAMAIDVMARIIAGEFPIKDAAMAVRLVEAGVKINRLEQGLSTEIVEDESAKVQRIRDLVVEGQKRRTG
jgi:hypothetical protein